MLLLASCAEMNTLSYSCSQDADCGTGYSCRTRKESEGGGNECRPSTAARSSSLSNQLYNSTSADADLTKYYTEECNTDRDCRSGYSCRSKGNGVSTCRSISPQTSDISNKTGSSKDSLNISSSNDQLSKQTGGGQTKKIENDKAVTSTSEVNEKDIAKKDDATCKSYGAKFGSAVYVQCRTQLASQRNDSIERQKTIEVLEKKIEALQTQLNTQQQTVNSNVSSSSQNNSNELALQQEQLAIQQEQLKVLKAQNERAKAEAALRYIRQQNNPATWGNPSTVRIVP